MEQERQGFWRTGVGKLKIGVAYYPEHWKPERWPVDARLMSQANTAYCRLAEFTWCRLEPEEGRYDFSWLDRAIEILYEQGIRVVLCTPTACPPAWLIQKHPEILPVNRERLRLSFGSRRHYCLTSQVYREHSISIVKAMAAHYATNPAVAGWQIDNEFGCHGTTRCYCDDCARAFRIWLRRRFGTLAKLNEAWGTIFWGQEYSDWDQIPLPWVTLKEHNPSLILDYYRFGSEAMVSYQNAQVDTIRQLCPGQFITHNMLGRFTEIDHFNLAEKLDFVGWDNYFKETTTPADVALEHDLARSFKHGKDFWVLEEQCGYVNHERYNEPMRPGDVRLKSLQAFARGAETVIYFRWRAGRFGSEQFHSGLLLHDGTPTRAYYEAKQTGEEGEKLAELFRETRIRPEVGICFSYENIWALGIQPHNERLKDPMCYTVGFYQELHRLHVPVDFLSPESDFSRYKLVIAPALMLLDPRFVSRIGDYVANGGVLLATVRTGTKDCNNVVVDEPLPGALRDVLGVEIKEFISSSPEAKQTVVGAGEGFVGMSGTAEIWFEVLEPRGAEVIARFGDDYFAGSPAVTLNRYHQGKAYYLGTMGDFARQLLQRILAEEKVKTYPPAEGIEIIERRGEGKNLVIILNHTGNNRMVTLPGQYQDVLQKTPISDGVLSVGPFDARFLVTR